MISSKTCFKCLEVKPLNLFYKHPMMADGHLNKCIECTKNDARKHRLENLDKIRLYDRVRAKRPERAKASRAITKKWRSKDARISAAHSAVGRALRKGLIIKTPCVRCGCEKSVAHHDDYSKKLDVMWLCQPCHKVRHKELKADGVLP